MPTRRRSGGTDACVIVAGWLISVSTPPRLSASAISFSRIENLTGAETATDSFEFAEGAVIGTIDDRDGNLTVNVAGFVQVTGDYDFARQILTIPYAGGSSGTATAWSAVRSCGRCSARCSTRRSARSSARSTRTAS